jgi:hypothetical protein
MAFNIRQFAKNALLTAQKHIDNALDIHEEEEDDDDDDGDEDEEVNGEEEEDGKNSDGLGETTPKTRKKLKKIAENDNVEDDAHISEVFNLLNC